MTTIKSALFTVVALLALTSVSSAASLNGVYLEASANAVGAIAEGSSNDAQSATTTGAVGKTAISASYGLGYMTDRSKGMGFDFGFAMTPGQAKIAHTSDSLTKTKVSLDIDSMNELYISPMINMTEDASVYFKYGWNKTDLKVVGDVNKINSMNGNTVALGTIMSWGSNLYLRTEAGQTEYDTLKFTGLGGTNGVKTSETLTVEPKINYGKIAIGYKF